MRTVGTVSRGIRTPIIKKGDDLINIVVSSLIGASKAENFEFHDRDIVGVTEAVLARSQGNYASLDEIAADVRAKFPGGTAGIVLPILSRNRFSQILRAIARGLDKVYVQLAYPSDEVGNPLISLDALDAAGVNPYTDVLSEARFAELFGTVTHPFTGVNYIEYYKTLCEGKAEIILANDPCAILKYTNCVLNADIHSRARTQRLLRAAGAKTVFGVDQLMTEPVGDSGYQPQYGLLGSNLATDESVKLFPRGAQEFADSLARELKAVTGNNIEVLVYGDGAFKDPVGGIWELADPVISPGFTSGLVGTPNELKLKYLADNMLGDLSGESAGNEMRRLIKEKETNMVNNMASQGTTPRRLTDLLGSLCDLTSGSGDKGTPVILIQGYFDTYAD